MPASPRIVTRRDGAAAATVRMTTGACSLSPKAWRAVVTRLVDADSPTKRSPTGPAAPRSCRVTGSRPQSTPTADPAAITAFDVAPVGRPADVEHPRPRRGDRRCRAGRRRTSDGRIRARRSSSSATKRHPRSWIVRRIRRGRRLVVLAGDVTRDRAHVSVHGRPAPPAPAVRSAAARRRLASPAGRRRPRRRCTDRVVVRAGQEQTGPVDAPPLTRPP